MSFGFARRRDDRRVVMGDSSGTTRIGATDYVCVRDGGPSGANFAAFLPRKYVSTNPDVADQALLDDGYLPNYNTPMLAVRMNDGPGPIQWRVDISSLVLTRHVDVTV